MGDWFGRRKPPKPPPPPPVKLHPVAVTVFDQYQKPVSGVAVTINPGSESFNGQTNQDGYVVFPAMPVTIKDTELWVSKLGFEEYRERVTLGEEGQTLRCGDKPQSVHDILLPPFRRKIEPLQRVTAAGRTFKKQNGQPFRPLFVTGFTLATVSATQRDQFLDWAVDIGFNGVRVLVGELGWASQKPAQARAGLPAAIEAALERGLYLEVTALTGTKDGAYDPVEHVHAVDGVCSRYPNTILELANEYYHGSQSDKVNDPEWLSKLGKSLPSSVPWAIGASPKDEGEQPAVEDSDYITIHLNRSRDEWNMVRRVRELYGVYDRYKKPIINNEPIGWGEVSEGSRRSNNAQIAFTMGFLSRGFDVGVVSHCEHGLRCQMPGPRQLECHRQLIRGFKLIPSQGSLSYRNVGHQGSPIKEANFDRVVRAYSFVEGGRGWTIQLGLKGDPEIKYAGSWHPKGTLVEFPGVRVVEVAS